MDSTLFINYYSNIIPRNTYSVSGFDLDHTIIKPKSKTVFPKDKNDWTLLNDKIKEKLNQISKENNLIIIFTNQKNLAKSNMTNQDFIDKINNIHTHINIDFILIASLNDDIYRKPRIGMWTFIEKHLNIKLNKEDSFYVGDMIGRKTDKLDTDLKFALNLQIKCLTPEEYFLNDKTPYETKLTGYLLNNTTEQQIINIEPQNNLMIIISGYPGSGKSFLANQLLLNKSTNNFIFLSRDLFGTKFNKLLVSTLKSSKPVIIEGLYPTNEKRHELKDLATQYNYETIYIDMMTNYDLSYHLNLYRNLYENKPKVPEIVYLKYKKKYQKLIDADWNEIIEYHPHITPLINQFYL